MWSHPSWRPGCPKEVAPRAELKSHILRHLEVSAKPVRSLGMGNGRQNSSRLPGRRQTPIAFRVSAATADTRPPQKDREHETSTTSPEVVSRSNMKLSGSSISSPQGVLASPQTISAPIANCSSYVLSTRTVWSDCARTTSALTCTRFGRPSIGAATRIARTCSCSSTLARR